VILIARTVWVVFSTLVYPLRLALEPLLRLLAGPLHSLAGFTFVAESEKMNKIARVVGQQVLKE
jgi:hypothetical protein